MPTEKKRTTKPEDYFWCDECEIAVAKKLAVIEEDMIAGNSDPQCPKCKTALVPYKEEKK